jgi:predicted dehydrogenase
MTRFLIVGLGAIGQRHLRNLRALLGFEAEIMTYRTRGLTHVVSDRLEVESEDGLLERYDVHEFRSLEEALADRPDAVLVCNPSSLHMEVALRVVASGCAMLIEKPLSHTYEGVERLLACVEEQGLIALVGYQLRFHPCLLRVRELLRANAIGRPLFVEAEVGEFLPDWHPYEDYRKSYAARSELGGGVILSQIHEMDYLYWLFGLPKRIFCVGGHLSRLDVDVEDVASMVMEFEADGGKVPVHLEQDYVQRSPRRRCTIVGEGGVIEMDLMAPAVRLYHGVGKIADAYTFPDLQRNQPFMDELRHFLACLRGDETPAVSVRDGAASLRMALAAKTSLQTGRVVDLE